MGQRGRQFARIDPCAADECYRAALFMVEATAYSMDIGGCRQGVHRLMSIKQPAVWSAGRDG